MNNSRQVDGVWRVCAPVFSFTSGLFDSVFARVSAFKVFGFSGIIWAFRKFGFFRDCIFCIRADNLALVTAGEGGGGRGGKANNVLCLAFLASGLFQDILSMSPEFAKGPNDP